MATDRNGQTIATGTDYLVVGTARHVGSDESLLLQGSNGQHAVRCVNADIGTIGSVYVYVDPAAPSDLFAGRLWLDTDHELLRVYDGTDWLSCSDHVLVEVRNDSGADMAAGVAVYVSGTHASGKPQIALADNDDAAKMPAIGLLPRALANGGEGFVAVSGTVKGIDTSAYAAGDALYVDSTPGALTNTRPTATNELVQKVALVTRSNASSGSVIIMGAGRTNDTPNDSYSGRYDTEAETQRSGATATTEIYYTARPDGDGYAESEVDDSSVPVGDTVVRDIYFHDEFDADPDGAGWTAYTTQPAFNATFANAKAALLAGLNDTDGTANTRGTLPLSLKMERTVVTNLLLDDYPGAVAGYSLRKLDRNYTGSAIRIREDSGNTETDIGFTTSGELDTTAIASHCGSANGYVVTWYDQSGNGFDAEQTTTTLQPQIYNGSAVLTKNGKPALIANSSRMDLPNDVQPPTIETVSTFMVQSLSYGHTLTLSTSPRYYATYATGSDGSGGFIEYFGYVGKNYFSQGTADNTQELVTTIAGTTSNAWTAYIDGSSVGSLSLSTAVPNTGTATLGFPGSSNYIGSAQEVIIYHSEQGTNRTGIERSIGTYYAIPALTPLLDIYSGAAAAYSVRLLRTAYTGNCMKVRRDSDDATQDIGFDANGDLDTAAIATFCGSANGYIETWYDQTSNGYDVTQGTAADQPKIYDGATTATLLTNGKPAPTFNGSEWLQYASGIGNATLNSESVLTVATASTTTGEYVATARFTNSGSRVRIFQAHYRAGDIVLSWQQTANYTYQSSRDTDQHLFTAYGGNPTSYAYMDGSGGTMTTQGGTDPSSPLEIGSWANGTVFQFYGTVQEHVVWHSDQHADRTGIESNVNNYYSIY